MKIQALKKLGIPASPGVYIFRDGSGKPIYIGRATSIRDRVKSYFGKDLIKTRGPRLVDMVTKSKTITWRATDTVLEAILLEGLLIRQYRPFYNVDDRDDKSSQYVIITDEEWPRIFLARVRDFDQEEKKGILPYRIKHKFGPFVDSQLIKTALKILRKIFPFRDKKSTDLRHESFYRSIGMSPVNNGSGSHKSYLDNIRYIVLLFQGKKKLLRSKLKREMADSAKELKFEQAKRAKDLLYALDHINDVSLIKHDNIGLNKGYRIEAYDVAHLGGKDVVGAMTVFMNGQPINSDYRKFKISKQENNDLAGLQEILERRLNHPEWDYPDLIVVDGSEIHGEHAESVLRQRRIDIPVVAVTKDEKHKATRFVGDLNLIKKYKKEIIAVNAEAHRFAIGYHRKARTSRFKNFE